MKTKKMALAVILGFSVMSPAVFAADAADAPREDMAPKAEMSPDAATVNNDERMKMWTESKDALEAELGTGHDKAFYRQTLEKLGYAITAVNSDDADYLEYEVMKDGASYEVQVDFENGVSNEVDVTTNIWKADSTKQAMADKDYTYNYPAAVTPNPEVVSDRVRGEQFATEKTKLEQELGVGHDRDYYASALEKMGYTVTSVNDKEADNLELEVVKGDTTYEVDVDLDEVTGKSKNVVVSANIWETEATEKAKGEE